MVGALPKTNAAPSLLHPWGRAAGLTPKPQPDSEGAPTTMLVPSTPTDSPNAIPRVETSGLPPEVCGSSDQAVPVRTKAYASLGPKPPSASAMVEDPTMAVFCAIPTDVPKLP